MKRIIALTLALLLMLTSFVSVHAEDKEYTLTARSLSLNKYSGTFAYQGENSAYYQIIDADGQVLMGEEGGYTYLNPSSSYPYFKTEVKSADGIHDEGLVDGQGKVLVPAEYADVNIISARWQAGVKLTPSSADEKDYTFSNWSTGEKSFFRIDHADIYFDGQKVGELNRSDYGGGNCTAYNAYLCVTNLAKEKTFYNSKLEKSPYAASSGSEFERVQEKGITVYYHQGSGQQAFTAACTLDPADLADPYLYDRGVVYDIQGNELFRTKQVYDTVRSFTNGYALVRLDRMYGLIDLQGNEVVAPQYEELGNYEEDLMAYGYISAVKDGKFGFVDLQGKETCPFVYSKDAVRNRGSFATIKNLDGSTIVLSAAVGELQEHFADVTFPVYSNSRAFVGQNSDKQYCVVDLNGNTLLPYTEGVRNVELTADGGIALVSYGSRQYSIFQFDQRAAAERPADQPASAPAPAADDSSWTCENGHAGNTGNFCSECGAAKPAEVPANCPSCGYAFGETVPNFCPQCGAKIAK